MKKFLFLFPAIFFLVHCGSGTGTGGGVGASSVLLNLQISNPDPSATGTAKAVALSPSEVSQAKTVTQASLTTCTLTVSGSGMTTLTHGFSVSSSASTITTSLSVTAGSSRTFNIDCSDGSATTNNITVGYEGSATADVSETTSSISINPQFKNLVSHTGTVLNYARFNQENSTQTKLTVGFKSALTSTEKTNMQIIVELDTTAARTSYGTIDANQSNGFVTGTKATPYILITGNASAPVGYLYDSSGAKTMKLNCAWGTNSSSNTEIACTFGITQFNTYINNNTSGQMAVLGSLTGASPWDAAPSGGKYAKYDLSANTSASDVASLISNGTTCNSNRNGETCSSGNCATDDGTTYSCQTPALASYGAACSTASDCVSNACAPSDICLAATAIISIAGGDTHTLILKGNGTVWAMGNNSRGQLGDGTTTDRHTPVQASSLSGVTAIAGGLSHSLALKSNGTVWAWGYNANGELGDGTTTNTSTPVQVSGLSGVTVIAGGSNHSLALKSNGTVWTWGSNASGQLGDGTITSSSTPVQVSGLSGITAIAGGSSHSLALKSNGTVWTWGFNGSGQLGDGTTTDSSTPVQVSGLSGVITAITAGNSHSVALRSDGTVWGWGYNGSFQLADGTSIDRSTPVQAGGLSDVTAIVSGNFANHNLFIKSNGTVWGLGNNSTGQLGDGTRLNSGTPLQASGLTSIMAIAGGSSHSVAINSDGTVVWAWGLNNVGQLGDGTTTERDTPVQVSAF